MGDVIQCTVALLRGVRILCTRDKVEPVAAMFMEAATATGLCTLDLLSAIIPTLNYLSQQLFCFHLSDLCFIA